MMSIANSHQLQEYRQVESKRMKKKMCHAKPDQKKAGLSILKPHKVNLRTKKIIRDIIQ